MESKTNEYKRRIGQIFYNLLKQATVAIILKKQPLDRTESEIDELIQFLKNLKFITDRKELKYSALRELATGMTYKQYKNEEIIYQ